MKNLLLSSTLLVILILLFTACEKDTPEIPNEEELITTLTYHLTPASGGEVVILSFTDLDGDGGNEPIIETGILAANESYTGALELLNESEEPAESITEEVSAEGEEHQFFFESTVAGLTVVYTDRDANGNPIGLSSTLTTGAATTGTITIILRHEPNKSAAGVADGAIANAGGETDIQVTFPIDVQ